MQIAVIFGGKSFEHEISIVSAIALKKVLTCKVDFISCDDEHKFYLIPSDKMIAKYFSSGEYKKQKQIFITNGGFYEKSLLSQKNLHVDVVLNLIHGADGEDGVMSSLFEFFGIKYIGAGLEASVLSFNKLLTKYLAQEVGVKALSYELISKKDKSIKQEYPFIIKPLRLGSSLGVSVVQNEDELDYALDLAFEYDKFALVEPFVKGVKEYNQAGYKAKDGFKFSLIEEPQKEQFLDFDKKYKDFSRTKKVFEADISQELTQQIKEAFVKIYEPLFEGSMIRCDFFVIDDEVYLNEINPNPGSMANYLYEDFTASVLDLAQSLPQKKNIKVSYDFIHSINSAKGKV
ncbi:MAG: D-alanine--D-alanine ligase [Campylobacteraceae bacterium]|nr:D-alanine--D-alanine ligase [Campylobacteraceae bacterium]